MLIKNSFISYIREKISLFRVNHHVIMREDIIITSKLSRDYEKRFISNGAFYCSTRAWRYGSDERGTLITCKYVFFLNINACSITITKQITRCVNVTLNNGEHVSFQYVQHGKKNRNKTERR